MKRWVSRLLTKSTDMLAGNQADIQQPLFVFQQKFFEIKFSPQGTLVLTCKRFPAKPFFSKKKSQLVLLLITARPYSA